jgi:DNA modification methylase
MTWRVIQADAIAGLQQLHANSVRCVITSPPYWRLRDYGVDGQYGMETRGEDYLSNMVEVFRHVRRVLAKDGTLWLNMGDCYTSDATGGSIGETSQLGGSKRAHTANMAARKSARMPFGLRPKQLVGMPWRLALALQADGWWLRRDIIWSKPNPQPESCVDRPTTSHEYLFLLSRSERYYYNLEATKEPCSKNTHARVSRRRRAAGKLQSTPTGWNTGPGNHSQPGHFARVKSLGTFADTTSEPVQTRNKRSVWTITTKGFKGPHHATFPPGLALPCLLAGSAPGDTVLDPFVGSGTVGLVAVRHHRDFIGIDLDPVSIALTEARIRGDAPLFHQEVVNAT